MILQQANMRLYKYLSPILLFVLFISVCFNTDSFDTSNGGGNYYSDSAIGVVDNQIYLNKDGETVVIGTEESEQLIKVAYQEVGTVGGRKYWEAFGFANVNEWCCIFVSWCADQCGYIDSGLIPMFTSISQGISQFKGKDQWMNRYGTPTPGMIVFFDFIDAELNPQRDGWADHVGIVASVNDGQIICIEGNYKNTCIMSQYDLNCPNIIGYGTPDYH